jgi:hypothetical protein
VAGVSALSFPCSIADGSSPLKLPWLDGTLDHLEPPGRSRALGVAEFIGETWQRRQKGRVASDAWMLEFIELCLHPEKREFIAQWGRDYAERLDTLSALELEVEWHQFLRLGSGSEEVDRLYAITFALFQGDTFQIAHPTYLFLNSSFISDPTYADAFIRVALMDIYLEWSSRHWGEKSLGSAVRNLPLVINPSSEYLLKFEPKDAADRINYRALVHKLQQATLKEAMAILGMLDFEPSHGLTLRAA